MKILSYIIGIFISGTGVSLIIIGSYFLKETLGGK